MATSINRALNKEIKKDFGNDRLLFSNWYFHISHGKIIGRPKTVKELIHMDAPLADGFKSAQPHRYRNMKRHFKKMAEQNRKYSRSNERPWLVYDSKKYTLRSLTLDDMNKVIITRRDDARGMVTNEYLHDA